MYDRVLNDVADNNTPVLIRRSGRSEGGAGRVALIYTATMWLTGGGSVAPLVARVDRGQLCAVTALITLDRFHRLVSSFTEQSSTTHAAALVPLDAPLGRSRDDLVLRLVTTCHAGRLRRRRFQN